MTPCPTCGAAPILERFCSGVRYACPNRRGRNGQASSGETGPRGCPILAPWPKTTEEGARRSWERTVAGVAPLVTEVLEPCPTDVERPRRRSECKGGPRPCPFVGCRWHLYLEVRASGMIRIVRPGLEPWELEESCALDAADRGGLTLDEVGARLGVTRERVRQIEKRALERLGARSRRETFGEEERRRVMSKESKGEQ